MDDKVIRGLVLKLFEERREEMQRTRVYLPKSLSSSLMVTVPYKGKCEHCALTMDASDCGLAEARARWTDEDGLPVGPIMHVCEQCLTAGDSSGPGYVPEGGNDAA